MTSDDIRAARATLGMTVAAFAGSLGVTARAVQHWEAGTRVPSPTVVKLIGRMREDHERKARRKK